MVGEVHFEVGEDGVGVVTLDNPDKRNALDFEMFEALAAAAGAARTAAIDGACRAVLVTGAGDTFSSGLDTSLFAQQSPDDDHIAFLQAAISAFEDLSVPTVAAVDGVAVGAGCQLALACHLRVAAPAARFGLLEARWGIIPDLGATWRLPRLVGLGRATELAVTARLIDASTALQWGLVNELADGDFATAARAYAARLAAGPTRALGGLPGLLRESFAASRDDALAAERALQRTALSSHDFAEAVRAAGDRRPPSFTGR